MAVLVAAQVWLAHVAALDPAAFLIALAFGVALVVSFRSTLSGLCLVILFQIRVLQSSETISLDEVAYALLFVATLIGWLLREGPTDLGRRILSGPLGRSILLFLGLCFVSIVVAALFGWSPLWWFRDFVAFSYMLLFFPIAAALTSRRGAIVVAVAFLILILFHSVLAVAWYAQAIATTRAYWQLEWQRAPLHEVFAMTAVVVGLTGFVLSRSARAMAAWVLLTLPGVAALAVSQTRGYWLATVLAAGAVVVMARGRRVRALWFAVIVSALIAAVAFATIGGKVIGVAMSMAQRLSSISSPLRSLSVQERVAEARSVLALIPGSPIFGHGLGARVSYTSPVDHRGITTIYTHNAYLYILYKLGIVGLGAFAAFYVRALRRTWRSLRDSGGGVSKIAMMAGLALLLAFLPLSLTSPQYYDKSSALIIALILGAAEAGGQLTHARARPGAPAGD
jgi:O-antigen ligase